MILTPTDIRVGSHEALVCLLIHLLRLEHCIVQSDACNEWVVRYPLHVGERIPHQAHLVFMLVNEERLSCLISHQL